MPHSDPEQARQWYRDRRREIRDIVEKAKDRECSDCGVKYPPCVMQFDHVRGVKLISIGSATSQVKSIKALLDEIAKCDVVCANCHAIRSHRDRPPGRSVCILQFPPKK